MLKRLFSTCCLCVAAAWGSAQEFNCKVTVMHEKINGVDGQVFNNMQRSIQELINQHKWTTDDYATSERIEGNILLNVTSNNINGDPDAFAATLSIQVSRPVYNSAYNSPLMNYVDKDVVFKYSGFNALRFDDNQVSAGAEPMMSNLSAVVAYYAYIALALDYDSFSPSGGTTWLKRAQNVVNNAPEGKGINGWKSVESTRNRYWLVDQMLNTRFQDVRNFWYMMHRESLDSMYTKPNESRSRILANIKKLYQVNRENPSSALMQFFFSAKSDEMQKFLAQTPKMERQQYITLLTSIDVPNAAKYNALK